MWEKAPLEPYAPSKQVQYSCTDWDISTEMSRDYQGSHVGGVHEWVCFPNNELLVVRKIICSF